MWTCAVIPLTNNAFLPNHFITLHDTREYPVLDLTLITDGDNDYEPAVDAAVSNDDVDDDDDDDDDDDNDDDMAIVANVSDDADNIDADDKDDDFVSTAPNILPRGKSLPHCRFLETEKVLQFL